MWHMGPEKLGLQSLSQNKASSGRLVGCIGLLSWAPLSEMYGHQIVFAIRVLNATAAALKTILTLFIFDFLLALPASQF